MKNWRQSFRNWPNLNRSRPHTGRFIPALLFSMSLLLLLPTSFSKGCGTIDRSFYGYSFLHPYFINPQAGYAPFLLNMESISRFYRGKRAAQIVGNLEEWQERFCGGPKLPDLQQIIYRSSVDELRLLRTKISGKGLRLDFMAKNSFAQYLFRNKCFETIDYLIYAKRCEPYVVRPHTWPQEDFERNSEHMQQLIRLGKREFMKTKSHYIRLRYAYQLVRLAHYAKDYEQVLELYDFLMPKTDNAPSIIEYWIEGHRAGALKSLGRNVEAAYIFSKVFEKCPSKRESAFRSFQIRTNEEWKQCLLLCEDDHERANLYVLRANAEDAVILEELEKIYELDPRNENLELLIVREIKKLEKDLLGYEFNDKKSTNRRYHNIPRRYAGNYVIELQEFVRRIQDDQQIARPDFWKVTEGYLELLAGDNYQAARTFSQARTMITNDTLKEQLEVFELALEINSFSTATDSIETRAERIIKANEWYEVFEDFSDFLDDKMAYLYDKGGNPGKAFLSRYSLKELKPYPDLEILNDLLIVCEKQRPNRLEREMIRQGDSTIRNDLLDIKATEYFRQFQLEAALEIYKEIPRADWDNYGLFNPFVDDIQDRVRRRIPDSSRLYNKGELIEQMLEYEYDAKSQTNDNQAAWEYYRLGLAFYNMSYFNYSWEVLDYFRSGTSIRRRNVSPTNDVVAHRYYPRGNRENFDCSQALYYFNKSRGLARDPNLGAKATFMAAKCERNAYYLEASQGGQRTYQYFEVLHQFYRDTPYYEEVRSKCRDFDSYVSRYYGG